MRVGGHPARSLHSSSEPDQLSRRCGRNDSTISWFHYFLAASHHIGATDVTRSVVWLFVCVLVTQMCPAKWLNEQIEMPFGGLTHVGPGKYVLIRRGQDRTNPFTAARVYKSAMRPIARLLWTLVYYWSLFAMYRLTRVK